MVGGPSGTGRPTTRGRPVVGTVLAYDRARGLGSVVDGEGREFPFHATAIADGTRSIAGGAAVAFLVAPGHGGRLEARGLVVLDRRSVGA